MRFNPLLWLAVASIVFGFISFGLFLTLGPFAMMLLAASGPFVGAMIVIESQNWKD